MSDERRKDDLPTLLSKSQVGDSKARNALIEQLYSELKVVARKFMARERADHTLTPTALVHEAFLKIEGARGILPESRTHLKALCALQMGRVLADYGRARRAEKRGGGQKPRPLTTGVEILDEEGLDVVEISDLLDRMNEWNERHANVVRMKVFSGMTSAEIAAELKVSETTVKTDWIAARAFLLAELTKGL